MRFNQDMTIIIEKGDSTAVIIKQIQEANAMPIINTIWGKIPQKIIGSNIQTGIYKVHKNDTLFYLATKIRNGIAERCSFTFIPGKTVYQYKKDLLENNNFQGIITIDIQDGDVLPNTYSFFCGVSKNSVLKYAKEQMEKFINIATSKIDFLNFYLKDTKEIIILASIIEKETSIANERAIVASVFKNRLQLGMKLQTDPTVIYQESNGTGDLGRPITLNDLKKEGQYNTYIIKGLPIGAISNPSKESIIATINPGNSDALYFVANQSGNGGHNFSNSYKEHLQNVESYRKRNNTLE